MPTAQVPETVEGWVAYFDHAPIPTLASSRERLLVLARACDDVTLHDLADIIHHDALMSLQTLRYLRHHQGRLQNREVSTVERAMLMVGVQPLMNHLAALGTIESQLASQPTALHQVWRLAQRTHLSALLARALAFDRHDIDTEEVMTAALLRDIAETLLSCFAPRLMQRIHQMQVSDPHLRSAVAQKVVLGFPMIELQLALIEHWGLPAILKHLMDERQSGHPRIRTVTTAAAFARHVDHGWNDAALPDDYRAMADILRRDEAEAARLARQIAIRAARDWCWYGQTRPPAAWLCLAD
jgi:HD-like signal output (HDOD) protein